MRPDLAPADLAALVAMLSHECIANRADGEALGRAFAWLQGVVDRGDTLWTLPADPAVASLTLIATYVEAAAVHRAHLLNSDVVTLHTTARLLRAMAADELDAHREALHGQTT